MIDQTDHATHYHDEQPRCPCGSTIQAGLCMKSGLLTDQNDFDYLVHVLEEKYG